MGSTEQMGKWRDPDSNRGHHNSQLSAKRAHLQVKSCTWALSRSSPKARTTRRLGWMPMGSGLGRGPGVQNQRMGCRRHASRRIAVGAASGRSRSPRQAGLCRRRRDVRHPTKAALRSALVDQAGCKQPDRPSASGVGAPRLRVTGSRLGWRSYVICALLSGIRIRSRRSRRRRRCGGWLSRSVRSRSPARS